MTTITMGECEALRLCRLLLKDDGYYWGDLAMAFNQVAGAIWAAGCVCPDGSPSAPEAHFEEVIARLQQLIEERARIARRKVMESREWLETIPGFLGPDAPMATTVERHPAVRRRRRCKS